MRPYRMLALPGKQFGACYLAGCAGHARRFNKKQKKESYV
jgi:Na+-translocating ferredoxin:NAD+ oxidoreductase RNF subunit RnfB